MPNRPIGQGWTLELPDEFRERVDDNDQHVFWYGDQAVYANVYRIPATEAEYALAQMTNERGLQPLERYARKEPGTSGEAWLLPEHSPVGDQYWGLNTWTQAGDSVACVTFYFPDKSQLDHALATWHTVKPVSLAEAVA